MEWVNSHPSLAIGGLVLAVLLIVGIIRSKSQASATTPAAATGDLSGLQKDANGNPVLYKVAQDEFISTSVIENSYNTDSNNSTTTTNNPPVTVTAPNPPPPPPTPANNNKPLIPYDFFPSHRFPTEPGNPNSNVRYFSYQGVNYAVVPGAGGRIWGIRPSDGKQILLYAPASYY